MPIRQLPRIRQACIVSIIAVAQWLASQPVMARDVETSIEAAREKDTAQRPLVISFGAASCGWCRKMEVDTLQSPEVEAVAAKFLWVKADVDEQKELAARYEVEGLPRTVVLDSKGRLIGSTECYMSPKRFVKFLEESLTRPPSDAIVVDELLLQLADVKEEAATRKVVVSLIEILSKPNRVARTEILAAIKQRKASTQQVLLELMSDERLAIRAAAGSCLKHCLNSDLTFDPFADKEVREMQLAAWRKAVGTNSPPT